MRILTEILVSGSVVFALAGVVAVCWQELTEYQSWRRSAGRSAFWPFLH